MTRDIFTKHGTLNTPEQTQQLWQEVLRTMLAASLTGVGVGSTARGLQGFLNLARRNIAPAETVRKPPVITLPLQHKDERAKVAKEASGGLFDWLKNLGTNLSAEAIYALTHLPQIPGQVLRGDWAKTPGQVPGSWPLATIGGAGGIYGGWKLLDRILDRRRERESEMELEKARREYEEALASQSKIGCALNRELDHLYELLGEERIQGIEKAAQGLRLLGSLTNAALLLATLTGIPASVWAYKMTKARQPSVLLRSARQRYRRAQETAKPTPVFAMPAPMEGGDPLKSAPDESEMEGSPLDKVSTRRHGPIVQLAGMK